MAEELQGGREGMASAKDRGGGEMCPHSKPGPLPMAAFLLALLCGDEKLPPFPCANRVTRPPAMCMGPAYGVKKISPMAFQCMFDTSNINFRIATIQFQPPPPGELFHYSKNDLLTFFRKPWRSLPFWHPQQGRGSSSEVGKFEMAGKKLLADIP